jgi:glycine/D-amino acid oxidase-like deaminating enzyme
VLPSLERGELLATQVAWRPIPADRFPSVGGVGGIVGYYEAVTHSGITLCLVLGRFITEEILDGKVNVLASPYRPDRFG